MQSSEMRKTGENLPVATASRTDMKRYTRSQLLEVILLQSKENTALKEEIGRLRSELTDRRIAVERAGNIAEASLALNKVFENAELAVLQYKENMRLMSESRIESEEKLLSEAREKADRMLLEAKTQAELITAQASAMAEKSRQEADAYWNGLSRRLEKLYSEMQGVREVVSALGETK